MAINEEWLHYQKTYARTHKARQHKVNICVGRANWNTCCYRDAGEAVAEAYGIECYVQDRKHNCIHCIEIARQ